MSARVPRLKKRKILEVRPDIGVPPLVGRELAAKVDDIVFRHESEDMLSRRPPPSLVVPPSCRPQPLKKPKVIEDTVSGGGQHDVLSFWGVWFVVAAAVRFRRPLRRQAALLKEINARLQDARLRALVTNVVRPEDVGVFAERITAGRNTHTRAVRASEAALLTVQANARHAGATPVHSKPPVPTRPQRHPSTARGDEMSRTMSSRDAAETARYVSEKRPSRRYEMSERLSTLASKTPETSAAASLARAWRRPVPSKLGDFLCVPSQLSRVESEPEQSASTAVIPTVSVVLPPRRLSPSIAMRASLAASPVAPRTTPSHHSSRQLSNTSSAANSPKAIYERNSEGTQRSAGTSVAGGESPGGATFGTFPANWITHDGAYGIDEERNRSSPSEPESSSPFGVLSMDPLLSQSNGTSMMPDHAPLHVRRTAFRPQVGPVVFTNKEFSEIELPTPTQHPSKAYPPAPPRGDGTTPRAEHRPGASAEEARRAFDRFRGQLHRSRREYHNNELARLRIAEERRRQALPLKRDFLLYECENNEGASAQEVHVRLRRFIRDARLQAAHGIDLGRRTEWFFDFYQKITDTCASATVYRILQRLQPHFEQLVVDLLTPQHFKRVVDETNDDDLRTQEVQFVLRHAAKAFRVAYVTFRELLELRHIHFVLPGSVGD